MKLRQWLLKSIPLNKLILEWCKTRDLVLLEEYFFNEKIKNFKKKYLGIYTGGEYFSDYKNIHICLVGKKEKISENLLQDYIKELEEFLIHSGRKKNDFYFIKVNRELYSQLMDFNLYPLLFILWKPEKPIIERILSGENENIQIHNNNIVPVKEYFYEIEDNFNITNYTNHYTMRKVILSNGNSEFILKYYIKKVQDKLVFLMLGMKQINFQKDYLKNLIDFYIYSERPVLKLEESLKYDNNTSRSIILLELKYNGLWKGIFFNCNSLFYRDNKKKFYILPDYLKNKKYIKLAQFPNIKYKSK